MSATPPDSTKANDIGGESENTWACVRSTLFPLVAYDDPSYPGIYDRSKEYPISVNDDGTLFPMMKAYPVEQPFAAGVVFNLPIGVYLVSQPFTPPHPNPNNLNGLWRAKLCIGLGTSAAGGVLLYVNQGTVVNYSETYPYDHQTGYDYESCKAALIGADVNVTCRFWPIPYPGGTVTPDEFTTTVTIDESMFPENQDWSITSNREGGLTIFTGSGNYTTSDAPTLFPPYPYTINWIQFPS